MIHFENIYLGAAGRKQQSEEKKEHERGRQRGEEKQQKKRGITRIGSNQGGEITKNPGAFRHSGISRARQSPVLC